MRLQLMSVAGSVSSTAERHLQRGVGFAGVGGARMVDDAPLEGARHGVPLVRLRQIHCLHQVPGNHTSLLWQAHKSMS